MTDWKTIADICREALSRDTTDRVAYLDGACRGAPELRRRIDEMLEPAVRSATADQLIEAMARRWASLDSTTDNVDGPAEQPPPGERTTHGVLSRSSPFSMLGADTLSDLLAVMHQREFQPGDYLVRQGDTGEFLLLILSGHAYARLRDAPDGQPPVGEFVLGDVVGEMSLVTDEPRTADVLARGFVRALVLSASDFHQLADRHPDLRVVLTEIVADRLGNARYDGLGGKDIHGYHVVQCVGRGGMGAVYEAAQLATGRTVALKMMNHRLTYDLSARRRFRREADILETLDHPSIARLYESFSAYKTEFLAMEFCPGHTLSETIAMHGPLGEDLVRRLLGQLAVALSYVHGRGVVHRDLKPSNILLMRTGAIKLLDFGIVTVERGSPLWPKLKTTSHAGFIGTPRYMPPEVFSERVADYRADLYGLACVAFEALSGRPAIAAVSVFDVMREHANFVLAPREAIGAGVSEEMYAVLARGFDHDPEKRLLDLERLASWAAPLELEDPSPPGAPS